MNPVSELSVEAGNKIIAEFRDGFYDKRESLIEVYNDAFDMDNTSLHGFSVNPNMRKKFVKKIRISDLQYHSSWDWLMPVWYKLWYESNVLMDKDIEWAKIKGGIARLILYGSILEAFEEIAKAIQWYNQNSKP